MLYKRKLNKIASIIQFKPFRFYAGYLCYVTISIFFSIQFTLTLARRLIQETNPIITINNRQLADASMKIYRLQKSQNYVSYYDVISWLFNKVCINSLQELLAQARKSGNGSKLNADDPKYY